MRLIYGLIIVMFALALSACESGKQVYAPVVNATTIESIPRSGMHRVQPGETLYSIAWRYGVDYRYLANRNRIKPPYHLHTGQIIYLKKSSAVISAQTIDQSLSEAIPQFPIEKEPAELLHQWQRPAHGPIIGTFSSLNKGINIGGQLGDPIYAAAAGKVVYCGNGLRSYGNLIIIKHNSAFLTAYAHNSAVFVREGEWVKSGQKIAAMGSTGTTRVMLHFEIRRGGQPVNPLESR